MLAASMQVLICCTGRSVRRMFLQLRPAALAVAGSLGAAKTMVRRALTDSRGLWKVGGNMSISMSLHGALASALHG